MATKAPATGGRNSTGKRPGERDARSALVLQGGAALGAYEAGVIKAVLDSGRLAEFFSRRGLRPQHVIASASLPPVFPATQTERAQYRDGGLISDTPLRPAINAIEAHDAVVHADERELIVADLLTPQTDLPNDMTAVIQPLFELVFFGGLQHDLKLFQ